MITAMDQRKTTPAQGKGKRNTPASTKGSTGSKAKQKSMFDFFTKATTPVQRAPRSSEEVLQVVESGAGDAGETNIVKTSMAVTNSTTPTCKSLDTASSTASVGADICSVEKLVAPVCISNTIADAHSTPRVRIFPVQKESTGKRIRKRISYAINDSDEDSESDTIHATKRKARVIVESDNDGDDYVPMNVDSDEIDHLDDEEYIEVEEDHVPGTTKLRPTPTHAKMDKFSRQTATPGISTPRTPFPSLSSQFGSLKRTTPTSAHVTSSAKKIRSTCATPTSVTPKSGGGEGSGKNAQRYHFLTDIMDKNKRRPGEPGYDKNTLHIPMKFMDNFTNFERQYWEIKSENWDTLVFFKKGKFYELYEKDADIGLAEFDLKMTDRVNMKMVGVPEKTFVNWASKFIGLGYKVARVDEEESNLEKNMREKKEKSTSSKKSIIHRSLSYILTAGTLTGDMVVGDAATFIMAVKETYTLDGASYGIVFCDASTGEFSLVNFKDDLSRTLFETLVVQIRPREIVLEKGKYSDETKRVIRNSLISPIINQTEPKSQFWTAEETINQIRYSNYFETDVNVDKEEAKCSQNGSKAYLFDKHWPSTLQQWIDRDLTMSALGGLVYYLGTLRLDKQLLSHGHFTAYDPMREGQSLLMDGQTLKNLEILENSAGAGKDGTLFHLLNHCKTPFGTRMLSRWVCHPLRAKKAIEERFDAIDDIQAFDEVREFDLNGIPDLERHLARIHSGTLPLVQFVNTLKTFRRLFNAVVDLIGMGDPVDSVVTQCKSPLLRRLLTVGEGFPDLHDALTFFETSFDHDEAVRAENIVPNEGVDAEYDQAKSEVDEIELQLSRHLNDIRAQFKNGKIDYKDIGNEKYQLEIPVKLKVPKDFILKSQTKAVRRYWTPLIENLHLPLAESRATFNRVRKEVYGRTLAHFDSYSDLWARAVSCISEFDCLRSLHTCSFAIGEPRCRPTLLESDETISPVLDLTSMRHPTISHRLSDGYVPNDTRLGRRPDMYEAMSKSGSEHESEGDRAPIMLLTGPNMGGKSTLLRQTCMAVVLAQLGCYLPAEKCTMTLTDRIFTRIGANDNILAGQSTFMVELKETSNILKHATKNSLVILDELGRGTSTFDGYAIAYAVLRHLISRVGCRAMFATHYHMLCEEFRRDRRVINMHMSCLVDEAKRDVTFLYQLALGVCSKSYGMNVASMAGVPSSVVDRAEEKAKAMEETGGYKRMTDLTTKAAQKTDIHISRQSNVDKKLLALLHGLNSGDEMKILEVWKSL
eukprot:CFRG8209T1